MPYKVYNFLLQYKVIITDHYTWSLFTTCDIMPLYINNTFLYTVLVLCWFLYLSISGHCHVCTNMCMHERQARKKNRFLRNQFIPVISPFLFKKKKKQSSGRARFYWTMRVLAVSYGRFCIQCSGSTSNIPLPAGLGLLAQ